MDKLQLIDKMRMKKMEVKELGSRNEKVKGIFFMIANKSVGSTLLACELFRKKKNEGGFLSLISNPQDLGSAHKRICK